MRSLCAEIKWIKSAARVLNRNCVNKEGLDLSKEVLWVSADWPIMVEVGSNLADRQNFLLTSNFDNP